MKTILLALLLVLTFKLGAQNKDLPGAVSNLQSLDAGSYVIAMDNTLQANSAGNFNLKTYGLVVHLLNNNVKIKWSIKTGKIKDGIDFTAMAEQFQPTLISGGISSDFKAGPFIINAADTSGVAALINAYYTTQSLTGTNRPKVYRLTVAASNVDIRYDMTGFKPKAEILNDGTNSGIHVAYMTNCGITTSNYTVGVATDLYTKCYTFASEPHNGSPTSTVLNAIRAFVQHGGNFLAQCAAVEAYENNAAGHFHSTNGITVVNSNVLPTATVYPNTDLTFTQYQGAFDIKQSGSVTNWTLASGSSFINNEHNHATGGTIASQTPIGASVAKLNSTTQQGGLVFYLGGHNFSSTTILDSINGIRMYMNAFLTPVAINSNCTIGSTLAYPLPVKLISFSAFLINDQKVAIKWITAEEINVSHFVIERSIDGQNFSEVGTVFAYGNTTSKIEYSFSDNISSVTAAVVYYRLRSVDIDGKFEYSDTRIIRLDKKAENTITILTYPNPVTNELKVTIPANWQNKRVNYELLGLNGQSSKKVEVVNSSQTETINISNLQSGLYFMRVSFEGQTIQQKIIKN
jgi:hypothetical protein